VTLPVPAAPALYGARDHLVVVGAGAAGWSAAVELRRLGYPGLVTVIGAEPETPYDRTSCCKGLLDGRRRPRDVRLDLRGCPGVEWRLGVRVEGLDDRNRRLELSDGRAFPYDGLVIATGTHASLPKDWPTGRPGLHLLHDMADAAELRRAMGAAQRVVVVGGGPTGCEVACIASGLGRKTMIVNPQRHLMARAVGDPIGALISEEHRRSGITLRMGRRVKRVEFGAGSWWLQLDDGEVIATDLIVAATGERTAVQWLAGSPVDTDGGLLCDESLRVRGLEGVVAAGSVARWPNLRYGPEVVRTRHWIGALEQGRGAAWTLLSPWRGAPPVTLLPRFWSKQRDLRIQVCGRIDPDAEFSVVRLRRHRRDTARAGVLASYLDHGRVVGMVAVNAPQAFARAYRAMLAYQDPVSAPPPGPGTSPELAGATD
jgi:NADPH-dependent 2,4-dienoyl-CoA reductase/sulfur reductase-like enzyme